MYGLLRSFEHTNWQQYQKNVYKMALLLRVLYMTITFSYYLQGVEFLIVRRQK